MKTILLVDDEIRIRKAYRDFLSRTGYKVVDVGDIVEARKYIKAIKIDLVLLDINMGEYGGDILFEVIRNFHQGTKIIICSVYPREEQQLRIEGADDYFDKSEGFRKLLKKIRFQLKEPAKKIVVIDDELRTRSLFRRILEKEGYSIATFSDNKATVQFLKNENNRVDLFILDLAMPNLDGCYFFEMIKSKHPEAKTLIASNYPIETQEAVVFTADEYFDKTESNNNFLLKVKKLIEPTPLNLKKVKGGAR